MKIDFLASFWKELHFRFLYGLFIFPLLATKTVDGQTNQSLQTVQPGQMTSGSMTMKSFWERPPIIKKMVYRTIFPDGSQQESLLRIDGTNALICPVDDNGHFTDLCTGRFQGIFWHYYPRNKTLVLADSRINKVESLPAKPLPWPGRTSQGRGGPIGPMEHFLFQRRINQIMDLGLPEIDRSTGIEWDKENHRLKALGSGEQSEDFRGTPLVLEFTDDENVPKNGILRAVSNGQPRASGVLETYKYDSNFFGGLFPIEFTRFVASPSPNHGQDVAQYTIRFKEFEATDQPIPDADINPSQLFGQVPDLTLIIWSNNLNYSVSPSGWHPIQSAEEVAKGIPATLRQQHPEPLFFTRTLLIVFFVSSIIGLIWAGWRRKKCKNNKTS